MSSSSAKSTTARFSRVSSVCRMRASFSTRSGSLSRHQLRPFPHPAQRVQPAAHRRGRDHELALESELGGQHAAAPGVAQLSQHPFLLLQGNIAYGRAMHSETSTVSRLCCNALNTKEALTVPISCILV